MRVWCDVFTRGQVSDAYNPQKFSALGFVKCRIKIEKLVSIASVRVVPVSGRIVLKGLGDVFGNIISTPFYRITWI